MCFEYKVRVTSRVSCNMTTEPSKEYCENSVCTPHPDCWHSGGSILTQAGPSEEFNSCIQSCDGGLYSKSCSTKCYNRVYGSSSSYAKTNSVYHDDLFATSLFIAGSSGDGYTCDGYYDSDGSTHVDTTLNKTVKSISWKGMNSSYTASATTPGRYYCNGWQNNSYSYRITFYADENGFFRKDFNYGGGSISLCGAYCVWTGCTGNKYLNYKKANENEREGSTEGIKNI